MQQLETLFYKKYAEVQTNNIRNFIDEIDWDNRFIGIKGSRGVGKTTLILQYIQLHYKPNHTVLYVSLDNLYFANNNLYDLADEFYKKGGELLAIDEVHRYPNWAIEIKNIYDNMPELKVIITGSSLLHLTHAKADLSRRVVMYNMPGLSFREFINFETNNEFTSYSLEDILENHISIAIDIKKQLKPLAYFQNYLNYGYYPFYLENKKSFHKKLSETILTVLEIDIPQYANIQTSGIILIKKLLAIISNSVPFTPNMSALSSRTGISTNTLKHYLKLLTEAELLNFLYVKDKGINSLNKPEKIYLNNTNIMYNIGNDVNIGNTRETFFFNQLSYKHIVKASKQTDFLVNNTFSFEVGGKNKSIKQIVNLENSYLVKGTIEIGSQTTIPLWLFGFLY